MKTPTHTAPRAAVWQPDMLAVPNTKAAQHAHQLARGKLLRKLKKDKHTLIVGCMGDPLLIQRLADAAAEGLRETICLEITDPSALAGCDIALFAGSALSLAHLVPSALRAGCVPVISETIAPLSLLSNYDAQHETGNSFLSKNPSFSALFAALCRAHETHAFIDDFRYIQRNALETKHR